MTVAEAMVKCLEAEKIKTVFGYPGAAICPFYEALSKSDIEHVLVRHEANAGHAASGYARIMHTPAVCVTTSGPGATNLITAIATAYMDSIPLVAITGQVSSELIGRDVFQEADITGSAEPFVKHSFLIKSPDEICECIKKAFYIAGSGRPGPVLIDIPVDIQKMKTSFSYPEKIDIRSYKPSSLGNKLQIKRFSEALKEAKKPLICAGGGLFTSDSCDDMVTFAEKCQIPVITTLMGLSSINIRHPLHYGLHGTIGKNTANYAIKNCDLLILLGARVGDRSPITNDNSKKIVHIDIDPAEIGKNITASIPIVCSLKHALGQILDCVDEMRHDDWISELNAEKKLEQLTQKNTDGKSGIIPLELFDKLNGMLSEKTTVIADVGQNQIWTANLLDADNVRFMTSGGMGTMGYSLPAAIGAKKANQQSEVIAICGDGSMQMMMMELATAVQHDIAVKIIVICNRSLGLVREIQKKQFGGNIYASTLDCNPDFVKIANAYGIKGKAISSENEIEDALREMINSEESFLLMVSVDEDYDSFSNSF